MIRSAGSLARSVELTIQWDFILRTGPVYLITLDDSQLVRDGGIGEFRRVVVDLRCRLTDFVHKMEVHGRDEAIRGWRNWLRKDPLNHSLKWLQPDMVPPAPFLHCKPHLTPRGSGFSPVWPGLMRNSARLSFPTFVALGKGKPAALASGDGWLPVLPVVSLPELTGEMLAGVVRRKGAAVGSLVCWGWREMKVLPVAWFDGLARILSKVEEIGVWFEGLLDAFLL